MEPMMVDLDVGEELVEAVIPGEECGEGGTTTGSRENEVNSELVDGVKGGSDGGDNGASQQGLGVDGGDITGVDSQGLSVVSGTEIAGGTEDGPQGDDTFKAHQQTDASLSKVRDIAIEEGHGEPERVSFVRRNGLIYRVWRPSGTDTGDIQTCEQLVLPRRYRATVLRLAHDIPLGGHLGITKTKDHILA